MRLKLNTSNRIRATCTDCYFDFKVKSINGKYRTDSNSINKLMPLLVYPNGHNSRFNTSWREVDHVFIPVFMDKKSHWILVDLDMSNLHLDVYNSLFKTVRDAAILEAVEPLRLVIPHIICQSKVLNHEIPDAPLSIRLCKDIPHQTNG
ncbi:Ulp1 protease family [Abeliophyllum distichum]|uniref:Ulp1 protease family n=1 Tax=Abeliophyllum distichum TaxID=126358 RepID=A0ABD1S8N2_9LAMI